MEDHKPVMLVVEDEPITRLYECDVAEESGFFTLGAFSADDAIMELEGSTEIGFMLTDVNTPNGVDGIALAETVKQRWPNVAVVVTSAQPENAEKAREAGLEFVPKPFTGEQLMSALHGHDIAAVPTV